MADEIIFEGVFERIKALYHLSSDAALARYLGMFPQDLPRLKKTENLPYKQILNACPPADWEFLFLGRRPPERSEGSITMESAVKYLADLGLAVTLSKPHGAPPGS
jgi:hypothetical protein